MIFICIECGVDFEWDESPSDERCLVCWTTYAQFYGVEEIDL